MFKLILSLSSDLFPTALILLTFSIRPCNIVDQNNLIFSLFIKQIKRFSEDINICLLLTSFKKESCPTDLRIPRQKAIKEHFFCHLYNFKIFFIIYQGLNSDELNRVETVFIKNFMKIDQKQYLYV